jgi:hypothetical protein
MTRKNYTLGIRIADDGGIQYATLNKNNACEATFIGNYTKLPLFVHERVALLKVADSYQAIMLGVGRMLMPNLYTIYLNLSEYKELYKLRTANDTGKEGKK